MLDCLVLDIADEEILDNNIGVLLTRPIVPKTQESSKPKGRRVIVQKMDKPAGRIEQCGVITISPTSTLGMEYAHEYDENQPIFPIIDTTLSYIALYRRK